mgnify:CR=1 FL=1|tara:strand:+ start:32798 stop:34144 length:1347 start_codon:yes stop_codon:yes gene_type:complete
MVVDDDADIRELIADVARDEGYAVSLAGDLRQAGIAIARHRPDVLLMDMQLPDGDGMSFWKELDQKDTQVVFVTGHSTVSSAIEALRCGAVDYLQKPVSLARLRGVLVELKRMQPSTAESISNACAFARLIGASDAMQLLYERVRKVAPTQATVLLIGESGTGKELAAEAIHLASRRHTKPFMAINCGAISPTLIESELFGHEKGSYTGADKQRKGYFERASGGTIFLDEITEMPMELQVRLLRVLETGRFMRIGSHDEVRADVRVIAATNRNPEEMVAKRTLREDLYHRLSVFPLELPPLRERGNDVLILAEHFLGMLNQESHTVKEFDPQLLEAMKGYFWPGNVRELRNFVYRSFIMADQIIKGDSNVFDMSFSPAREARSGKEIVLPVGVTLEDAKRQLILATLQQCGGVKKMAAEVLGISLKTLYNRLSEYGIDADERDVSLPN